MCNTQRAEWRAVGVNVFGGQKNRQGGQKVDKVGEYYSKLCSVSISLGKVSTKRIIGCIRLKPINGPTQVCSILGNTFLYMLNVTDTC